MFLAGSLAGRVPLPSCDWTEAVGDGAWPVDVSALWSPDLGHGGHDLPPQSLPAAGLVRRDVVRVRPEERGLRARCAAGARLRFVRTAWTWMHKLRRAMVRPDRDRLGGPDVWVEIDQTFIGGRSRAEDGLRYANKSEVVIAVEREHPADWDGPGWGGSIPRCGARASTTSSPATSPPEPILYSDGDPATRGAPSGCTCATNGSSCRAHRIPPTELRPASTGPRLTAQAAPRSESSRRAAEPRPASGPGEKHSGYASSSGEPLLKRLPGTRRSPHPTAVAARPPLTTYRPTGVNAIRHNVCTTPGSLH